MAKNIELKTKRFICATSVRLKDKEGKHILYERGDEVVLTEDLLKENPHVDEDWPGWVTQAALEVAAETVREMDERLGRPSSVRNKDPIAPEVARNKFLDNMGNEEEEKVPEPNPKKKK